MEEDKLKPLRVSNFPECEKFSALREKMNAIGDFIEWLSYEKKFIFAKQYEWDEEEDKIIGEGTRMVHHSQLLPSPVRIEDCLAEFFGIDENKLEVERRAILEECRKANAQTDAVVNGVPTDYKTSQKNP